MFTKDVSHTTLLDIDTQIIKRIVGRTLKPTKNREVKQNMENDSIEEILLISTYYIFWTKNIGQLNFRFQRASNGDKS